MCIHVYTYTCHFPQYHIAQAFVGTGNHHHFHNRPATLSVRRLIVSNHGMRWLQVASRVALLHHARSTALICALVKCQVVENLTIVLLCHISQDLDVCITAHLTLYDYRVCFGVPHELGPPKLEAPVVDVGCNFSSTH